MSFGRLLDEIAERNRLLFGFDLGESSEEEIISPYYKQYVRDEGK